MSAPPTGPPPAGGDRHTGTAVEVVTWIFTSIALITLTLRLYGRLRLTRNPGWDDFWIVLSMVFNLTYAIVLVVAVDAGSGRHQYYLGPSATLNAIKWNRIALVPGVMSLTVPKLGVALLLIRLLNPSKIQRYILYFISWTCIIISALWVIFNWVECRPSTGIRKTAVEHKCLKRSVFISYSLFIGIFSALTDIYLAAYPCFVLCKLKMSIKKKTGLSAVLGLGFVAGIFAIYKCTRIIPTDKSKDYMYAYSALLMWISVEGSFIIIAANLPTLRPVFLLAVGRPLTARGSGGRSSEKRDRNNYKLSSGRVNGGGSGNPKGAKDPFSIETIDLVGDDHDHDRDSIVERILPPNRIHRTYDFRVEHGTRHGDGNGIAEEYAHYLQHDPGRWGHHPQPRPQAAYMNRFSCL